MDKSHGRSGTRELEVLSKRLLMLYTRDSDRVLPTSLGLLQSVLDRFGPIPLDQSLQLGRSLCAQVRERHLAERVVLCIDTDRVQVYTDDNGLIPVLVEELGEPLILNGSDLNRYPPEMSHLNHAFIPGNLDRARLRFASAGIYIDPRRIDIYQLGAILCWILTATGPIDYLRSPLTKARVPAPARPIIDGALGLFRGHRMESVDELLDAMNEAMA